LGVFSGQRENATPRLIASAAARLDRIQRSNIKEAPKVAA